MRLISSVALPRSALFTAVAAMVLVMAGPVSAQTTTTGSVSPSIINGFANTSLSFNTDVGHSSNAGSVTIQNNALLTAEQGIDFGVGAGSNGTLTIQTGGDLVSNTSIFLSLSGGTAVGTIDGVGSTISATQSLNVGFSDGTGTLNIQNGGTASADFIGIGGSFSNIPNSPGDGTVNLTGNGSSIHTTSALLVGQSGIGRLNISSNATATITSNIVIGSSGTNVDPPFIGSSGTLDIQSGGQLVSSGGDISIGSTTLDATGIATINGTNSRLTTSGSGSLDVGDSGSGTLTVTNGGFVQSSTFGVGTSNSGGFIRGSGITNLGGTNSSIQTTGSANTRTLSVGDNGDGTLNITGGATFTSTGSATIADETADTGTININGSGSTLNTGSGFFSVGSGGNGNLNIGDNPSTGGIETGGVVNSLRAGIATQNTASPSTVSVNGTGTQWNLTGIDTSNRGAMLQLGSRGNATVTVSNGGNIVIDAQGTPTGSSQGGLLIGGLSGQTQANGTLNIDGTGSSVTVNTGDNVIGRGGTGIVNVINGGTLNSSSARTEVIGRSVGSNGTVNVTGAGSTWNAGDRVFVSAEVDLDTSTATGAGGNGTLNVANGGAVFAQDIINGASGRITGGGGTITANIQNDGTIAAGNSPGLMTIVGNLDHNAGATIEVEIAGTTFNTGIPQFDYDRIDVSDDPATTGTTEGVFTIDPAAIFSVEFISGFSAASGDSFDILIADTISGLVTLSQFTVLPVLTAGLSWELNVIDSARDTIQLAVTGTAEAPPSVPEPGALLILVGGITMLGLVRRRRAATIH